MKISYNWLKDYIKTDLPADRVAEILTSIGLEVESVERVEAIRGGLEGLIVAEVLTCDKHPDADKLSITTVNTGAEVMQVVCGAPNVEAGQKVVLATVGATLYPAGGEEGFKIKKSKIRGAESCGMLCAEDEIGVGTSHNGIIVLPADAKVGLPAIEMFDIQNDTIFEIGLTPNRVDAASHYGVARDLAAYLQSIGENVKAQLPDVSDFKVTDNSKPIEIVVENSAAAPRYMGVTVSGIKIEPSPEWLQAKLRAIGINPKNNVVDITNFVLHECGQPLHAFDLDKVKGGKIIVKNCPEGIGFTTLDGVERKLSSEDLMICNGSEPMCIAGIFGGVDSGISESTTGVFIESAYFHPVSVRKTAKRHGLSTDASFRYERGADPNIAPYALKRCANMICDIAAGAHVSCEVIDLYPEPAKPFEVMVDVNRINSLIGKEIPVSKIEGILRGLEIDIVSKNGSQWKLNVPPYRVDVQREADVVEEVLRIYGFNNIENPQGVKNAVTYGNKPTTDRLVSTVSDLLASLGCNEVMSNSLTKASYYEHLKAYTLENSVRIMNPLSSDLDVMRQTLIFNALEVLELNINRRNGDLKIFEVGNCYFYDKTAGEGLKPYREEQMLAITVTGNKTPQSWNSLAQTSDFFTVKSLVEKVLERLGVSIYEGNWDSAKSDLYAEAFSYSLRGSKLLEIGVVSRRLSARFDIKQPIYYAEINVAKLQKVADTVSVRVTELNKFQAVRRDLALLIDKSVTFGKLREIACKAEKKLLKQVTLFDVYEGDKLPQGKKSYALGFIIEDADKTLTDTDITRVMSIITSALSHHAGAEIRS